MKPDSIFIDNVRSNAYAIIQLMTIQKPNIPPNPIDLNNFQDEIYRDKIIRAREMSEHQRLAVAIELTKSVFGRMHEGAMWQLETNDPETGWTEVCRRLQQLRRVRDQGRYVNERPENQ